MHYRPQYINVRGSLMDLSVPKVMGILNITPDSFYPGSRVVTDTDILRAAAVMIEEGADILDLGGYSSRPGADDIPEELEAERVLRALKLIRKELPGALISVDTFRSGLASRAVSEFGADMINDITAGEGDPDMFRVISEMNVPYIIMHMKGNPRTMQDNPVYGDVIADILKWSSGKIAALHTLGVKDIIFDPGFGFGKTAHHNFEMLRRFSEFSVTGLPLMAGLSRKSMIWRTLGSSPAEALNGTTVLNTLAIMNGADILRVHDVKQAVEAVKLVSLIKKDRKKEF